jgi:5-methyltetrahydropteroyltriglutamate--homocysteine methyltransferase
MRVDGDRILTTHTGSLPRPQRLGRLLAARERGEPIEPGALDRAAAAAVTDVVRRQAETGLDIVNDGEMGKPSYATYVRHRLTGFSGTAPAPAPADLADYPEYAARLMSQPGLDTLQTLTCTGPVRYEGVAAVEGDIERLTAASEGLDVEELFLTAASPGVIALFFPNAHYGSDEEYLSALAEAMRAEYQAIHRAGLLLQVDCPDLAMGRHMQFAGHGLEAFRRRARLAVEALDYALADIPPERARLHLCWGNYEGPHHHDVRMRSIIDIVLQARPAGISYPAANPRHAHEWRVWDDTPLPEGKTLIPGVIDPTTNFIEHPDLVADRIVQVAARVGPRRVIAGTDCGFGTFAGYAPVDPAIAWAKLGALVEGARRASERLL